MENINNLQTKLQTLIKSRTQLETQYQENKIVLEEFDNLNENSNIFKLIGPVLLKQDYIEAKDNVNKRLDFINNEIENIEKNIKQTQNELSSLSSKLSSD